MPVLFKFAHGWPKYETISSAQDVASYMTLTAALTTEHAWDAHACAYSAPEVERRLASPAALACEPAMVAAIFDVDAPGECITDEWRASSSRSIEQLLAAHPGGYIYWTRSGYRIVYTITPVVLRAPIDAERWSARYLAWLRYLQWFGIEADKSCQDWTRIFRLPRVVRDGVPQVHDTIGDPTTIRAWDPQVVVPEVEERAPRAPSARVEGALTLDSALAAWAPDSTIVEHGANERRATVDCPNADEHTDGRRDAMVFDRAGVLGFKCLHGHCTELGWQDFRRHHEPDYISSSDRADASAAITAMIATHDAERVPAPTLERGTWAHELEQALADVHAALGTGASTAARMPMFATSARQLLAQVFPPVPWLVHGLITTGGIAAIATEPKAAKTWSATEIAIAVATGTRALGEFATCEPASVAYFYAEDFAAQVQTRVRALLVGRGMTDAPDNLYLQPRGQFIDVTRDEDLAWIVASCRQLGPIKLLVLDPLRDIHSGEEDTSDAMSDVMRRLRLIGTLLACTVLYVHHTGKTSADGGKRRPGQKMRGSGAIHGSTDSGVYLAGLSGNGQTEFTSSVTSEVKGARSAGTFDLTLKIEDGPNGTAIRAAWSVTRGEPKVAASKGQDATDDAAILEFLRRGAERYEYYSANMLRTATHGVPDKRAREALARLGRAKLVESTTINPHTRAPARSGGSFVVPVPPGQATRLAGLG